MLKKQLGFFGVFSIAAGAMISSGLFILPGLAFEKAGASIVVAYLLAGLLMLPSMLSNTEMATAMPKSGGSYFFVERSLGPMFGCFAGLANWLAIALKATFAMVGIGALATVINPDCSEFTVKLVAAAACLFFMAINLVSVKSSGLLQTIFVAALLVILIGFVMKSVGFVAPTRFSPFVKDGSLKNVFAVAGMVFVSFGGLTKVIDVSEEVKNAPRNIPLGMFSAFAVVVVLYFLVVFVTVGVLDANILSGSLAPISLAAKKTAGLAGELLLSAAAFLAFATTANAGLLSASRTPMAMSRDGLVPEVLSKASKKFSTPYVSILFTGSFMLFVIFVLSVENLVKTASAIMIIMFVLMNASMVILRKSGIQSYRPTFRAPFAPWLQIGTIIVYLFLIFEMGYVPLALTGSFAIVAMLWYLFYVQRRIDRQSAIVYLVKSIVSKHIQRSDLEDELKQLALERDEVIADRFDMLVRDAVILDIDEQITVRQLFERAAEALSARMSVSKEKLYQLFIAREKESTTVIKSGLAIPHIVIDGSGIFDVLLVRCKGGIIFSELGQPVKTAFMLLGSPDERNYHLKALMSIAHIVSEPEFERRWFDAKNAEQLRDIVLLSGRKRHE